MIELLGKIGLIITFHFLFDWIFQKRSWANTKHTSHVALTMHVSVITLGNILLAILMAPSFYSGLLFVLVNSVAHYITDYITSNAYRKATSEMYKINTVAVDQMLHLNTYILTFGLFFI